MKTEGLPGRDAARSQALREEYIDTLIDQR